MRGHLSNMFYTVLCKITNIHVRVLASLLLGLPVPCEAPVVFSGVFPCVCLKKKTKKY